MLTMKIHTNDNQRIQNKLEGMGFQPCHRCKEYWKDESLIPIGIRNDHTPECIEVRLFCENCVRETITQYERIEFDKLSRLVVLS